MTEQQYIPVPEDGWTEHNITQHINAYFKEQDMKNKNPITHLKPYYRVKFADGTYGVYLGKACGKGKHRFDWAEEGDTHPSKFGSFCERDMLGEDDYIKLTHIYARPFHNIDEASTEDLLDITKLGDLVWQLDDEERELKEKLALLSEQMKQAQEQLDAYIASKG